MKVVVLGAGAVGAYYGGQLARAGHEVTCFARGATLAALRERGLEIRTPEGTFQARVAATDRVEALGSADFALLAVKGYSLEGIAPVVRHCAQQGTAIEPLLNGVVAVARARGIALPDNEAARVLALIDGLPAAMKPSFLVDLEAGGPTELDILSGAVARFAEEARVATPIHDTASVALDVSNRSSTS